MTNETMSIFFPLKIISYPQYDCSEDEREDISPREAVVYEDQILAAIAKENRHLKMTMVLPNISTMRFSKKRCIARILQWKSSTAR